MDLVNIIKQKQDAFIYAPASREQIYRAEKDLDVIFSEEYTNYISEFGVAIFDSHELTGICDGKRLDVVSITKEQRKYNSFVPNDLYVIECLDIDGIVIWQNTKGEIYQSIPNGKMMKVSNNIAEYINET